MVLHIKLLQGGVEYSQKVGESLSIRSSWTAWWAGQISVPLVVGILDQPLDALIVLSPLGSDPR